MVVILIVCLGGYATWKVYCQVNNRFLDDRHDKNAINEIDIKQFVKAVTFHNCEEGKYKDIATSFYQALNTSPIAGNITVLKLTLILDGIGILLYITVKERKEKYKILTLWISFNIGLGLYCLLLMATYMFAFTEQEGRILASYSRYMATYFIAWTLTTIGVGLQRKEKQNIIILIIAILLCVYPLDISKLGEVTKRKDTSGIHPGIQKQGDLIQENVTTQDKVYIIYQDIGGGWQYHVLRYCISPIVTNLMYEWSLGPAYNEQDIWSYDITKEEWEEKLIKEEFDYVFIAKIDQQFIDIFGDLLKGDINFNQKEKLENTLWKVQQTNEHTVILDLQNI